MVKRWVQGFVQEVEYCLWSCLSTYVAQPIRSKIQVSRLVLYLLFILLMQSRSNTRCFLVRYGFNLVRPANLKLFLLSLVSALMWLSIFHPVLKVTPTSLTLSFFLSSITKQLSILGFDESTMCSFLSLLTVKPT